MKTNILTAIRLTLVCVFVLIVIYPLFIWVIAQAAPAKGKGETVLVNNKVVGYKLEGQAFSADNYFWGRPSAVNYNAAGSAGSNKGPTNPDYLAEVNARIDSFLVHNPAVKKEQIPSELVTASGGGLDPHISPAAAMIQVKRIAAARSIPENELVALVKQYTQNPLARLFGTSVINVLELNIALDKMK